MSYNYTESYTNSNSKSNKYSKSQDINNRLATRESFLNHNDFDHGRSRQTRKNDSNMGEITGESMNVSDLEQGMPMRYFMDDIRGKVSSEHRSVFSHQADFDLFDKKSKTDVSYYDPNFGSDYTSTYSDVGQGNEILNSVPNKGELYNVCNNDFTWSILPTFFQFVRGQKLTISPFTMMLAFTILYRASSGKTQEEMRELLNLPGKESLFSGYVEGIREFLPSKLITVTNCMFVPAECKLNKSFINMCSDLGFVDSYDNRDARREVGRINSIVNDITNGIVKDAIDAETVYNSYGGIISITTFSFRGGWGSSFSVSETRPSPFSTGSGSRMVKMMHKYGGTFNYSEDSINKLIEMDTADPKFAVGFMMSKTGMIPSTTSDQLDMMINTMKPSSIETTAIPKFTRMSKFKVDNVYRKMGLKKLFNKGQLPALTDSPLHVATMLHQAVIVIEEGYQGGTLPKPRANSRAPDFVANKPFLYYVRHKPTSSILLVGIYL